MTKRANKKGKQVIDVKAQEPKKEQKQEPIQVVPGNIGVIQVQLLSAILVELRKINGRLK